MKGLFLVIVGSVLLYCAWKIVGFTRKGATKEVESQPEIHTDHRKQEGWTTGIKAQPGAGEVSYGSDGGKMPVLNNIVCENGSVGE